MKKLFLSHFNGDAEEVALLANELRFRGIQPWVDKQGGFKIADESAAEAKRAISEDCFGFLLYATPEVFGRPFIRDYEVPPALKMNSRDPQYLLFAVPRRMGFEELSSLSQDAFKHDFSSYHTKEAKGAGLELQGCFQSIACGVLEKCLSRLSGTEHEEVGVQFSTRELFPPAAGDLLTIDGRAAYVHPEQQDDFDLLVRGLRDAKRILSQTIGRPRLIVHGSKHLSAAFLFGRVFQPFEIQVRQTPNETWSLNGVPGTIELLEPCLTEKTNAQDLVVQISSRVKELSPAVDDAMEDKPFHRLVLRPNKPLGLEESSSTTFVRDCYVAIENAVKRHPVQRIHLFAAAPQAVLMGLGQKFAGMPPTHVYDYNGCEYDPPRIVPGGVL